VRTKTIKFPEEIEVMETGEGCSLKRLKRHQAASKRVPNAILLKALGLD
jgi:hypothetical protein